MKVYYSVNFVLILLFLLIYDGEFLILIPIALNINILNFGSIFILLMFILLLTFVVVYDLLYSSLE